MNHSIESEVLISNIKALVVSQDIVKLKEILSTARNSGLSKISLDFYDDLVLAFKELNKNTYNVILICINYLGVLSIEDCIELMNFNIPVFVYGTAENAELFKKLKKIGFNDQIIAPAFSFEFFMQLLEKICEKVLNHNQIQKAIVKKLTFDNNITRKTLDNAPVGVVKLDKNLRIIEVNSTIARLLNVNKSDLEKFIGRHVGKIFSGLSNSVFDNAIHGEKMHLENYEIAITNFVNAQRFWDIAIWPILAEDSQLKNIMMLISDTTEKVNLAKQREDIIATLAHDLKTPLIGAERTLESLIEGNLGHLSEVQATVLGKLKQSNHNLLSIIKNIVDVYRFESQDLIINYSFELISEVIISCINDLNILITDKQMHTKINLLENEPKLAIDKYSIYRVIFNILDNAIKFSKPNSSIIINLIQEDLYLSLSVTDFGCGMEVNDQLFSRFYQGQAGRKNLTGSGLGLYLIKQIVELHHGQITVDSKINGGTIFTIKLPLAVKNGSDSKLLIS